MIKALIPNPIRIIVTASSRLIILAIDNIMKATISAPKNANIPIPATFANVVIPSIIAATAPKLAPDEIPNKYGSAKSFCITVCITNPVNDNPAPIKNAVIICGIRIYVIAELGIVFTSCPNSI